MAGSDRRSIGAADDVAREIGEDPALVGIVVDAMMGDDPVLRMRAADAVEKASRDRPELLAPFKKKLLRDVVRVEQQVNALQGLVDLADRVRGSEAHGSLQARVDRLLDQALETGSPAVKARARKLSRGRG